MIKVEDILSVLAEMEKIDDTRDELATLLDSYFCGDSESLSLNDLDQVSAATSVPCFDDFLRKFLQ